MIRTDQAGLALSDIQRLNSPGFMMMYGGPTPPGGWLFCDGSAISRVTYVDLFNIIGTTWGVGDGTTTFNIPDSRGRSPMGAGAGSGLTPRTLASVLGEENHILSVGELASHNHTQNAHTHVQDAHTHTQNSHNHTQDAHNHTLTDPGHTHPMNSHNHTQNAHNHAQDPHYHAINCFGSAGGGVGAYPLGAINARGGQVLVTGPGDAGTAAGVVNFTATNQAQTGDNNATTSTMTSSTTGVASTSTTATNQATTATNQNTTATNQNTTATNNATGDGNGHNTVHPVFVPHIMIKF